MWRQNTSEFTGRHNIPDTQGGETHPEYRDTKYIPDINRDETHPEFTGRHDIPNTYGGNTYPKCKQRQR